MTSPILLTLARRWVAVLIVALGVVGVMAIVSIATTPQFTSTSKIFVSAAPGTSNDRYQEQQFSLGRIKSYADIIGTTELAESVIIEAGVDLSATELLDGVSAQVSPDTIVLAVSYEDSNPERAQLIARAYATALSDRIAQLETPRGQSTSSVTAQIVDAATLPRSPTSPNTMANLLLGAILGLLVGVMTALLREHLDGSVNKKSDVSDALHCPVVAHIPDTPSLVTHLLPTLTRADAATAEAYRLLRANCDMEASSPLVITLVSAQPESGVTTTVVNLGLALREFGLRVLLIDANARRPRLHTKLGLSNETGLGALLSGDSSLDHVIQAHPDSDLHVLTTGSSDSLHKSFRSGTIKELLDTARGRYDCILVDAPPLLTVSDALPFCLHSDRVLMVARWRVTRVADLVNAADQLDNLKIGVWGAVINQETAPRQRQIVRRYTSSSARRPPTPKGAEVAAVAGHGRRSTDPSLPRGGSPASAVDESAVASSGLLEVSGAASRDAHEQPSTVPAGSDASVTRQ